MERNELTKIIQRKMTNKKSMNDDGASLCSPHGIEFKNGIYGGSLEKTNNTKRRSNKETMKDKRIDSLTRLSERVRLIVSFINLCIVYVEL